MDLAISHRSVFLARVTKVAFTRSPGAGGDSSAGVRGAMLGVVGGLRGVESDDGSGLGGGRDAIEFETVGFSTPIPTGLSVGIVEPVGGVYVGNEELEIKYKMASPKTAKRMYRT